MFRTLLRFTSLPEAKTFIASLSNRVLAKQRNYSPSTTALTALSASTTARNASTAAPSDGKGHLYHTQNKQQVPVSSSDPKQRRCTQDSGSVQRNSERVSKTLKQKTLSLSDMVYLMYQCRMVFLRTLARTKPMNQVVQILRSIMTDRRFIQLAGLIACLNEECVLNEFQQDLAKTYQMRNPKTVSALIGQLTPKIVEYMGRSGVNTSSRDNAKVKKNLTDLFRSRKTITTLYTKIYNANDLSKVECLIHAIENHQREMDHHYEDSPDQN
ncbi:hypothetical protein QAD02_005604 [Eretmocerus hayati]|uniref:Uncharacterized protein n=1 Tax=Eretmocerus hayati TaxID=131215 RepID=A0ACC2NTC2_9HYME|nr:hypothetical protein QAD02_005604 [Eretmocerus hayati]